MERLDRLFRLLGAGGLWRGEEIQRQLGITQPVMSRLMREAGPRVVRFGRCVATRYALPRAIAGVGRQAPVFRVDEHGAPSRPGTLHFLAGGDCWLERRSGSGQAFPGLPPFIENYEAPRLHGARFSCALPRTEIALSHH